MTAMITAAVVGVVGGAINANRTGNAIDDASQRSQSAADRAIEEDRRQYDQTREDWSDWRETGQNALKQINDPNEYFLSSPDYQWRLDEGTRNTENLFSVKGGGGNAMRALAEYGQNFASNEFGSWYDRQLSRAGLGTTGNAYTQRGGENATNNINNSRWRTADDQSSLGLYGAQQQAGYTNEILGTLMGGIQNKWGKPSSGGVDNNSFNNDWMMGSKNYKWDKKWGAP